MWPRLDGVQRWICAGVHDCLRSNLHSRVCADVYDCVRTGDVLDLLQRRLVSRLLVGSRRDACLGLAHDLCRIVSVGLGRELRSGLLQLLDVLDLHCGLRPDVLNLYSRLRTSVLHMHGQCGCSLQLMLDVR